MRKAFKIYAFLIFSSLVGGIMAQNQAFIEQKNGVNSYISTIQIGGNNVIKGFENEGHFIEDAIGLMHHAAYQFSLSGGTNCLDIEQIGFFGKNKAILYQLATDNNIAHLTQEYGLHAIMLKEISTAGSNETHITQLNGFGFINLEREAFLNNTIPSSSNTKMTNPLGYEGIYQEGWGNVIAGAVEISVPFFGKVASFRRDLPARQISYAGGNWLEIWQTGCFNMVGLYQEAFAENTALIHQSNGFNLAVAYQKNLGGSNYLMIEQSGGMYANVYQSSKGGANRAIIVQK